jgi:hypothetical protein
VVEQDFLQVAAGQELSVPLRDSGGQNLANGLYYVVTTANGTRVIDKLLLLR